MLGVAESGNNRWGLKGSETPHIIWQFDSKIVGQNGESIESYLLNMYCVLLWRGAGESSSSCNNGSTDRTVWQLTPPVPSQCVLKHYAAECFDPNNRIEIQSDEVVFIVCRSHCRGKLRQCLVNYFPPPSFNRRGAVAQLPTDSLCCSLTLFR